MLLESSFILFEYIFIYKYQILLSLLIVAIAVFYNAFKNAKEQKNIFNHYKAILACGVCSFFILLSIFIGGFIHKNNAIKDYTVVINHNSNTYMDCMQVDTSKEIKSDKLINESYDRLGITKLDKDKAKLIGGCHS